MIDSAVLPGYLLAVLLVTIAPGPDMAYIVAAATARGARAGVLSATGMALGMVVHVTAAALGLAAVVAAAPWTLVVVRLAGAGFLAWLAVGTLRSARAAAPAAAPAPGDGRLLVRAALTNLTNPKVILFFAAFLPHFVRPGHASVTAQFLLLGVLFLLVGLAVDSTIGLTAGRLGAALAPGTRAGQVRTVLAGLTFAVLSALLVADVVTSTGTGWRPS